MPKVTVIIPVYNVEQYLARCLDSVINQTYEDYEIICINDCSPDGSQKLLESYHQQYPDKISVLLNEENRGQGYSRERGIERAQGEYILFIDGDDYIEQNYIETYIRTVLKEQYDVVVGGYTRDINGEKVTHGIQDSPWCLLTYPIACAKLFRKEFLLRNALGFSDVRFGEDVFFALCLYTCEARYCVIDYQGYYYYYNVKSTTGAAGYDRNIERVISKIFDKYIIWASGKKLTEEQYRRIEYTYITNMINALITYGHGCRPHVMKEKYQFFMKDLKKKYPDYIHNPYLGITKAKGQTMKIRLGVGVTMLLHRLHLDAFLFWLISWL